jgi:hypothetical protein
MKMIETNCYTCQASVAYDPREAYFVVGYGDLIVECDDPDGHLLINIDNNKEMVL